MKIILLQTYISAEVKEPMPVLCEPLGLISLATALEIQLGSQVDVKVLDLYAMGFDKVRSRSKGRISVGISEEEAIVALMRAENPRIVGIQCNFSGYAEDAMEVAKAVRKALPDAVLVVGGAHASHDSKSILARHPAIDAIVRGEGEVTFCELVKAVRDGTDIANVFGVTYRDKTGPIGMAPDRELIADLDTLPWPNRKYIDMKAYARINKKVFPWAQNYPVAVIMASRGCPFDCIFCSTKNMWSRQWRGRSPKNIVREIEELVVDYRAKEICFTDDQFFINKKWVHDICDLIIEKKFKISLSITSGVSIWLTDEPLLKKMKKAGFYHLCFPIESGNPKSLQFIRKPIKLDKVLETVKTANKLGFWTSANFLLGFPYETREEIDRTVEFAYSCGVDYPDFLIATPLPGAEMYDIFKKEGLLTDETQASGNLFVAKCPTVHFTARDLIRMRHDAAKGFWGRKLRWYLVPRHFTSALLPKISSWVGIRYVFKLLFLLGLKKHKRS